MDFKTSFLNEKKLPLVVEPSMNYSNLESLLEICSEERELLQNKLLHHGALLFRGFPLSSETEFEKFVRAFSNKNLLNYAGGASPRVELTSGGVYSSTEYPPELMLALHNELSYSSNYPEQVYFCCITAPESGGETPIADSRAILKKINSEIVNEFKRKQIKYVRNLRGDTGSGYSWQDAFETEDKSLVEKHCRLTGAEFQWKKDNCLQISQIRPATAIHPQTGEEVWFNQADGFHPSNVYGENYLNLNEEEFRLNVKFADESLIDISMLNHIREVLRKEMVVFKWREGDVLFLDNLLIAHGRMPFSGKRKIILAMT